MEEELRFDAGEIAASYTTPDGWERVYLRLARPNWDYRYFNRDGSTRIETISPEDLFDKGSIDTAKMMPLGIGHPLTQRVDSLNVDAYVKGSTGHTVLREKTADGEFLGITATLFSESAKQAVKQFSGVSPGYSVKLTRGDSDDRFNQKSRVYNHAAVGVIPRGGPDVRAVFEGLRVDSSDGDNPIWVATYNADCYNSPIDHDFITSLLERSDALPGLTKKTPVDLNRYPASKENDDDDDDDDKDTPTTKKKRSKPMGFGEKFKRKDSMSTTTFVLDGVTYQEVPIALAQAISPILKRTDSLTKDLEAANARADDLEGKLSTAEDRADSLDEELTTAKTRIDKLEKAEDGDRTDEDEALALALDIASTVDQMRSDGLMLQQLGVVENFNTDFRFIADNMGELQREMLSAAYPDQRTDGYNDRDIAIAYDTAMGSVRSFASQQQQRTDEEEEGDRQDMYYPDLGMGRSSSGGKPMFNKGLPTLHKVGSMSKPMKPTNQTMRSLLNKYTKMEDAIFEEASKGANAPSLQHPMAARIM